eukprot:345881_1
MEVLFGYNGLPELLYNTIMSTDEELRPTLFKSIIFNGHGTRFPGFSTRMERDLKALWISRVANGDKSKVKRLKIKMDFQADAGLGEFIGASVFAE